mgnify:CR=1 FL=1
MLEVILLGPACVVDTSIILRLWDDKVFNVVPSIFAHVVIPGEVMGEIINHKELKIAINTYITEGKIVITTRADMDEFERATYDSVMSSLRRYLSSCPGARSNRGEMAVAATAIARTIPVVLMDDSEAERVISRIIDTREQISIYRSAAVVRAAKALGALPPRIERALLKKWATKGRQITSSEDGAMLAQVLSTGGAD